MSARAIVVFVSAAVCAPAFEFRSSTFVYSCREALHYEAHIASRPPLILLHGLGLSVETWSSVREQLAEHFDVYAIDLRGFGRSSKPHDKEYTIRDQAIRIRSFLHAHKLQNATLIGHSYGGAVAMMTYLLLKKHNEHSVIGRLILIDAPAYTPKSPPLFIRMMRIPVLNTVIFQLVPKRTAVRYVMRHTYHQRSSISPALVDAYASHWKRDGARQALLRSIRLLYPKSARMLHGKIANIDRPVLLLWGDSDPLVKLDEGKRLAGELPNARLKILHDCGHVPAEEQPNETTEHMLAFLLNETLGGVR